MFQLGDRVVFQAPCVISRYGRVSYIRPYYRSLTQKEEPLYTVRYYDVRTGMLMECPDLRCRGLDSACPICSHNSWADELRKIDDHDVTYFKKYGFIQDADQWDDSGKPMNLSRYVVVYRNKPQYKGVDLYVHLHIHDSYDTVVSKHNATRFSYAEGKAFVAKLPSIGEGYEFADLIPVEN